MKRDNTVDPTLKDILEHAEVYHQVLSAYKHITYQQCKIHIMPSELGHKFSLPKGTLLNSLLEAYYQWRLEQDETI